MPGTMASMYKPLSPELHEIRLLTLLPSLGDPHSMISCWLEKKSLLEEPLQYHALSYVWGDRFPAQTISLDGHVFEVTQNLFSALCQLRHTVESRVLWVDAICINQDDPNERSHQVMQMGAVYAQSVQVFVWLGESDQDVFDAFKCLLLLHEDESRIPPEDELRAVAHGLQKLFENTWWTRIWTLQELVVACADPLFICGSMQVPWLAITNVILELSGRQLENKKAIVDVDMVPLYELDTLRQTFGKIRDGPTGDGFHSAWKFENALLLSSQRDAKDPRDKIYALLGMLPDVKIIPDYTKPIESVFQLAMVEAMSCSEELELLIQAPNTQNPRLPTWCVDFAVLGWNKTQKGINSHAIFRVSRSWGASSNEPDSGPSFYPPLVHDLCQGLIQVSGKMLGRVDGLHQPSTKSFGLSFGSASSAHMVREMESGKFDEWVEQNLEALSDDYHKFCTAAVQALSLRFEEVKVQEVIQAGTIWKVFSGGLDFGEAMRWNQKPPSKDDENDDVATTADAVKDKGQFEGKQGEDQWLRADFPLLSIWLNFYLSQKGKAETTPHLSPQLRSKLCTIHHKMSIRAFLLTVDVAGCTYFTTEEGYIGRVPCQDIRQNDVICILERCSRPAVLRPVGDGSNQLITFAYTHDAMPEDGLKLPASVKALETRQVILR